MIIKVLFDTIDKNIIFNFVKKQVYILAFIMGWFFNKNKNNQDQNAMNDQQKSHSNNNSFFQSKTSFYSKKRMCQNDPDDNKYLICKTIIKDKNGTTEEEERVPKNTGTGNYFVQEQSDFKFSDLKNPFFAHSQEEKQLEKLPSFFMQPNFFDFNRKTPVRGTQQSPAQYQNNLQTKSFFKSYGSSKTCHIDSQDNEYMICKSKIYDGKQTKQVEERLKVSEQIIVPSFRKELNNFGSEIDNQIHELMNDLNSGFNFIAPFIGPMVGLMGLIDSLNPQNPNGNMFNQPNFGTKHHKQQSQPQNNKHFSTSSNKKDTKIYDL